MKKPNIMFEDELVALRSDPVTRGLQKQFPVSKKLRLLKMQRASASFLPAAIALLLLLGSERRAIADIITLTNGVSWTGAAPTISGNPQQLGGLTGSASVGGQNYFLNTISANYNSAQDVAAGNTTPNTPPPFATLPGSFSASASPMNCSLTLNGGVQFPDSTYNPATATLDQITLTLTGWINAPGNNLTIGPITITAAEYAAGLNTGILTGAQAFALWGITCYYGGFLGKDVNGFLDFSFTDIGPLPVNVPAPNNNNESLTISSVGRVLYKNDDTFVGDVPDLSPSLALLGIGTISLLACDWRRRMAKA